MADWFEKAWQSRYAQWSVGLVLGVMVLCAVAVSAVVGDRENELQKHARYNVTWLTSQSINEAVRFLETVSATAIPGSHVDRDDADLRAEILANRLQLLRVGEAADFIAQHPDLVETVKSLEMAMVEIFDLVGSLPHPEAANRIRSRLEPLVPRLMEMASLANIRSADLVARDQQELSQLHWLLNILMLGIMLCSAVLVGLLFALGARMLNQLKRSAHIANIANAAKSQFLANMSHELRTPLNGMLGMLQLAKFQALPPEGHSYVEKAIGAGSTLLSIIGDLLDFSQIESGNINIRSGPFSIRKIASELTSLLVSGLESKSVQLQCVVAPSIPDIVVGDEHRIRQILTNLLNNAMKFTPSGSIHLAIEAQRSKGSFCGARIFVEDTGIGIPADKIGTIFDPFVQADISNTRRYGGFGLGLSIVHDIVKNMGGTITVESELGRGTSFEVFLPLSVAHSDDGAAAKRIIEQPTAAPLSTKLAPVPELLSPSSVRWARTPNILLVEDEAVGREVARSFISRMGYAVDVAVNGSEALKLYSPGKYDLIVMDRHMPEMDGIEATRKLREAEKNLDSQISIIGFSAGASQEERRLCIDAGMDDYITKPVTFEDLSATIGNWLAKRRSTEGAST